MSDREAFLKYQNMTGEQLEAIVSTAVGCPYTLPLYTSVKNKPLEQNMSMLCFCTALMGSHQTAEDWIRRVGESLLIDVFTHFLEKGHTSDWSRMTVKKGLKILCFGDDTSNGEWLGKFSSEQMISLCCIIADCEEERNAEITMFDDWIYENVDSMISCLENYFKGAAKTAAERGIPRGLMEEAQASTLECITRIKNRVDSRVNVGVSGSKFIKSIH